MTTDRSPCPTCSEQVPAHPVSSSSTADGTWRQHATCACGADLVRRMPDGPWLPTKP